jgi:RNA polymerase sigma-70 factor, ECF subfamily
MTDAESRRFVAALVGSLRGFVERRVSSAADVDDVLQDVFLRLQRGLPGLRDTTRLGPWVYRVVRNTLVDRARAARSSPTGPLEQEPSAPAPDAAGASEPLAGCIAPFVARLPPPYREAVTLVDLRGHTHQEAASLVGLAVPGMKSRVQRGRAKLRAMFEACCLLELDVRRRVVDSQRRPGSGADEGCGC